MTFDHALAQFKIMGVVNITPDSFSDGGFFFSPERACDKALMLLKEGADFVDLGAESSRPGAEPITAEMEWQRLEPVLCLLKEKNCMRFVTVDTMKPQTMERLVDWGIAGLNDIGGRAPVELLSDLKKSGAKYHISMHMHRDPKVMQDSPMEESRALGDVANFFAEQKKKLLDCGFEEGNFWLDPGIGFGKSDKINLHLLSLIPTWRSSYDIAVGVSRKSLIGRLFDLTHPLDRELPSKALELGLILSGARLIRTHEIKPLVKIRKILSSG